MTEVSNSDLLNVLLDMKGDIGELKASTGLLLKGLESHSAKIATLEQGANKEKGAIKMLTAFGTVGGAVLGSVLAALLPGWLRR